MDITTLRATEGSHCPFFKHMSTVKRVLIHCVSETTEKSHYHQKFGVKPLWDFASSCHVSFRFSGVSVGWGAREGTVELSESKSLSLDDYDLDDWQPTDTCPCCSYFCGGVLSISLTVSWNGACIWDSAVLHLHPEEMGQQKVEEAEKWGLKSKRKHWLRDKQKPAAKWKEANPSLEKAKDREVFVDRLIQHNLPL